VNPNLRKLCIICIEASREKGSDFTEIRSTEFANSPKQCNAKLHNPNKNSLQILEENVSNQVLEDEDKWDRELAFNIADSLENVVP
jgi:hypothetical protein